MEYSLRQRLKSYFLRGSTPTEEQFSELIDACVINKDDGISRSEHGVLELSSDVKIQGNLFLDGTFWLAKTGNLSDENPAKNKSPTKNTPIPSSVPQISAQGTPPIGAIFLWLGDNIPQGYQVCDGQNNTPVIIAPSITSPSITDPSIPNSMPDSLHQLRYIIKVD